MILDINDLKTKTTIRPKIKTYLEGVYFDFEKESEDDLGPHVAMTSGLGAASLMNDSFLFKTVLKDVHTGYNNLTDEETQILKDIGEYPEELLTKEKSLKTNKDKQKETITMEKEGKAVAVDNSEVIDSLVAEINELKKENKTVKATTLISRFEFSEEVGAGVIKALVGMEDADRDAVVSAFDAILTKSKDAVEKIKKEKKTEENPLKKEVDEEVGFDDKESNVSSSCSFLRERVRLPYASIRPMGWSLRRLTNPPAQSRPLR